jgi:tetratricopeptide (TPR) repeat protein
MNITKFTTHEWKEKGNKELKNGFLDNALVCYTNALELTNENNSHKAILLKNRAAVYLKQNEYNKVIEDCNEVLKITPDDPKALFRRCQALEGIEKFEEAYRDALEVLKANTGDKTIQVIAGRLFKICQEKIKQNSQLFVKVKFIL